MDACFLFKPDQGKPVPYLLPSGSMSFLNLGVLLEEVPFTQASNDELRLKAPLLSTHIFVWHKKIAPLPTIHFPGLGLIWSNSQSDSDILKTSLLIYTVDSSYVIWNKAERISVNILDVSLANDLFPRSSERTKRQ